RAARAGRLGVEQAAREPAPAVDRTDDGRRGTRHRPSGSGVEARGCRRRSDARGRGRYDGRTNSGNPQDAPSQNHSGDEAEGRNAAPAVRANADARVSRRSTSGTNSQSGLLPESTWLGTLRSASRDTAAGDGQTLRDDAVMPFDPDYIRLVLSENFED